MNEIQFNYTLLKFTYSFHDDCLISKTKLSKGFSKTWRKFYNRVEYIRLSIDWDQYKSNLKLYKKWNSYKTKRKVWRLFREELEDVPETARIQKKYYLRFVMLYQVHLDYYNLECIPILKKNL